MKSHHALIAWQRAHAVAIGVHRYGARHWSAPYAAAIEQLRRASLSVELNIAEGFAHGPGARCRNHIRIAYGSAVETTEVLSFLTELDVPGGKDLAELTAISRETQALTLRLWRRSPT